MGTTISSPAVLVSRFTDKTSALDSQNTSHDVIKNGDGQWIAGHPYYSQRRTMFTQEAERVVKYPLFNGIMFHGYTLSAVTDDRRSFDIACYRMNEYLTGLYVTPGMDGKCLGAFISYQEENVAGIVGKTPLKHSLHVVYSACQVEDRVSWLTVLHDAAYFEEYIEMIKGRWSEMLNAK